jgi:TM2 domain-containing membrane protein YozV
MFLYDLDCFILSNQIQLKFVNVILPVCDILNHYYTKILKKINQMKKIILLSLVFIALFSIQANAQTYAINKLKYDYRTYIPEFGDNYNPALSGVCSFFIPGLGQMISGEVGRGLAFMGGYVGCAFVYGIGVVQASSYYSYNNPSGVGTILLGLGGMLGIGIWSIVDAVKVAKVNNLYIRDYRKKTSFNIELSPYVSQINIKNEIVSPVGMSMRIKF